MNRLKRSVRAKKHVIVRKMFIDTADDNYKTARFCFIQHLNTDFFWLSLHSAEKYLKAILLFNHIPCKEDGHNIKNLYQKVLELAPDQLCELRKPDSVLDDDWITETGKDFIDRLHHYGNSNNRYDTYGIVRLSDELFKLDQIIYQFRRMFSAMQYAYKLGEHYLNEFQKDQSWWRLHPEGNLEKIIDGKRGRILQHMATDHNFGNCSRPRDERWVAAA